MDAVLLGQVDDLLLGEERRVFNLVDGGHRLGVLEQVGQVRLAVVADANGAGLALGQGLHELPGLDVVVVPEDVALAVGEEGEAVGVAAVGPGAVGVHAHGPVHEVEVDVVEAQGLEGLVQAELDAGRVRVPELGDDKDVLALDARVKGGLEALADLVLVGVAVGGVDELVSGLEGDLDGLGDLTGRGLPCSWLYV